MRLKRITMQKKIVLEHFVQAEMILKTAKEVLLELFRTF